MKTCCYTVLCLMLLAAAGAAIAAGPAPPAGELRLTLEVPLDSELFADTPVAVVDDEPITMQELKEALATMHAEIGKGKGAAAGSGEVGNVLERLVNTRLLIREARNIGLDKTETIKAALKDFSEKLLLRKLVDQRLEGLQPDEKEMRKEKSQQLSDELIKKYVTLDEKLFAELDFERERSGYLWFAEDKPADFKKLRADQRSLAVVHANPPSTITVGDFARELEEKFFHGMEKAAESKTINKRKTVVLDNMLFLAAGLIEARRLGLDQTEDYHRELRTFENSTLFSAFVEKAIVPDIKFKPEEVQAYYDQHRDEFSSPVMLRLNSLVFDRQTAAQEALAKLRKGADFKWVSANSTGLVDREREKVKPYDTTLLSINTLPEELQDQLQHASRGDSVLLHDPDGFYYVLAVAELHPSQLQPFEKARDAIAKTLFDARLKEQMAEWTGKLREAYGTRIYLKEP